jgi:hypothetical protein
VSKRTVPFHLARPPERRVSPEYFGCPIASRRSAMRMA